MIGVRLFRCEMPMGTSKVSRRVPHGELKGRSTPTVAMPDLKEYLSEEWLESNCAAMLSVRPCSLCGHALCAAML
jgi:hypothetical protein